MKWCKNIYDCTFPALLQEKLNGVFALCEGGLFYSRNGNVFDGFMHDPRAEPMLGELYVPGVSLQEIVSLVRAASPKVRFYVHWFPERTFEANVEFFLHEPHDLKVRSALVHSLAEAREHPITRTGEGAVLKDKYGNWFKLKNFITEEFLCVDATVGKSLSLTLRAPNGELFRCGSFEFPSEHVRHLCNNKPIGKKITVRFLEYTNRGVPRNATAVAIRDYE